MRVLQIHNRYRSSSPSGENNVADLESEALLAHGHDVEHHTRCNDSIDSLPLKEKLRIPARFIWNGEAGRELRSRLHSFRPDVVHIHNLYPLFSSSLLYACAEEGVPVVATLHNYRLVCAAGTLFRDGAPCHDCVGRSVARGVVRGCYAGSSVRTVPVLLELELLKHAWRNLVSAYICISAAQRDTLQPFGLPPDRVFVKWNLVPYVQRRSISDRRRPVVMFAGRLTPVKGLRLLMEAWDEYAASSGSPGLQLEVAGAGPMEEELRRWALGRPDVRILGLLSPEDCRRAMGSARAVVVPSVWEEPFGMVVVEAMSAGAAVIVPRAGAFQELLAAGQDVCTYEQGSSPELARIFREVDSDGTRWEGYGRQAREAYESRFDPEDNLRQLVEIYEFAVRHPVQQGVPGMAPVGRPVI